jgi:ABC-2 type transport system ATP-binding protein
MYDVPKKVRRERIEQLLSFVGLADRRNDFVKNFSGGMKRRLKIARGLIHHPKILFLVMAALVGTGTYLFSKIQV